jgi:hypothetical protein
MVTAQTSNSPKEVRITAKLANTKRQPDGQRGPCVARIWHWRAKKYLYAADYGIKGFPIGR